MRCCCWSSCSSSAGVHPYPSVCHPFGCADTAASGPSAGSLQWFVLNLSTSESRGCSGAVPEAAVLGREEPCCLAAREQACRGQGKTETVFSGFTWEQKKRYFTMTPLEGRSHWLPGWAASTLLGAVVIFFFSEILSVTPKAAQNLEALKELLCLSSVF